MKSKYFLWLILAILAVVASWYFFFSAHTQNPQGDILKQTSGDCVHEKNLSEPCMKEYLRQHLADTKFPTPTILVDSVEVSIPQDIFPALAENIQKASTDAFNANQITIVSKQFSTDGNSFGFNYTFLFKVKDSISYYSTLQKQQITIKEGSVINVEGGVGLNLTDDLGWH